MASGPHSPTELLHGRAPAPFPADLPTSSYPARSGARLGSSILAFACALLVACGGTGGTVRGVTLGDEVEAPGDGAATYSLRSSPEPVLGDERAATVRSGIEHAATTARVTMEGDGRLGILAGLLAERIGDGATLPPPELTRFFAWHLGLPESTVHSLLVGVPDPVALEAAVADSVGQYLRRQRYDAYGAAVIERQGLSLVVITLSVRSLTLTDVPRSLEHPGDLTLEGALRPGVEQPALEVQRPDGTVDRIPGGRGPEFRLTVPFAAEGTHEVRIFGTSGGSTHAVARFPVYVGRRPPRTLRLGGEAPRAASNDPAGVEAELFRMINDARAAEGMPALSTHEGLVAIARAHSTDMATHGFFAHQSPTTGGPADRLRAATLASGLVLENLGRGRDATSIHASLLATPQHRANMLNRDVTHVGIGVATVQEDGHTVFLVTQIFFKITETIDTIRAPATLLELVNRARTARNAPLVDRDPNLDAAAQEAADAFLRDPSLSQDDVMDDATGRLRRFAIAYRRVGGVLAVVASTDEAATLEPTFDPGVRYIGIGVAQGNRPDQPPNSIVVVYMLAWTR